MNSTAAHQHSISRRESCIVASFYFRLHFCYIQFACLLFYCFYYLIPGGYSPMRQFLFSLMVISFYYTPYFYFSVSRESGSVYLVRFFFYIYILHYYFLYILFWCSVWLGQSIFHFTLTFFNTLVYVHVFSNFFFFCHHILRSLHVNFCGNFLIQFSDGEHATGFSSTVYSILHFFFMMKCCDIW